MYIGAEVIRYVGTLEGVSAEHLHGFFEGWPEPPTPETHLRTLEGSDEVVLAVDGSGRVVGFVAAVTDGVLCAYISLLEVLPGWRGRGIGGELVRRMLARLDHLYMVDLLCDPGVRPFYASLGMRPATGMMVRRYERQAGAPPSVPGGHEQDAR